ncbi:MAG: sulfurtransferase [Hyphomonas sp.]|uniref:sulfurtransferase n=1 Tax=Hyphomonas sp. TaxID=87 RepID=UPI00181EBD07|nr:sulfurtransferase [Hyphomonas sp.]MBA3067278.1 sulfurtransferase [Hyphomonas sp.]MBU3920305.1 sulfurtransferase [Alphaproteobacteria bacterium]MBU4061500.1 sulfurtransferase [Alphaproteobacteria bacterium]MBU4163242.1 sulfurtransferase [Alphaproteobacteria bacterium]
METGDPLVSADWLLDNIEAPDLRIVDATWFAPFTNPPETGRQAWMRGHIPKAVHFDIDDIADTSTHLPHMLPDAVKFSSRVRRLGLGDGNRIVIYDQNNFFAGARAWWMFRVMGHDDIKVLDGGLNAWVEAGGALDDLPPVTGERHFTPRVRTDLVMDAKALENLVGAAKTTIIDARPDGRFFGRDPEPRPGLPSGHIPGSINLPGSQLITGTGRMKSAAELKMLFKDPAAPTVTTCGSGITAAITALALARLGNFDVAVYDGSWTDWASDPARPIATSVS